MKKYPFIQNFVESCFEVHFVEAKFRDSLNASTRLPNFKLFCLISFSRLMSLFTGYLSKTEYFKDYLFEIYVRKHGNQLPNKCNNLTQVYSLDKHNTDW